LHYTIFTIKSQGKCGFLRKNEGYKVSGTKSFESAKNKDIIYRSSEDWQLHKMFFNKKRTPKIFEGEKE
jgi:hypothetical protein